MSSFSFFCFSTRDSQREARGKTGTGKGETKRVKKNGRRAGPLEKICLDLRGRHHIKISKKNPKRRTAPFSRASQLKKSSISCKSLARCFSTITFVGRREREGETEASTLQCNKAPKERKINLVERERADGKRRVFKPVPPRRLSLERTGIDSTRDFVSARYTRIDQPRESGERQCGERKKLAKGVSSSSLSPLVPETFFLSFAFTSALSFFLHHHHYQN